MPFLEMHSMVRQGRPAGTRRQLIDQGNAASEGVSAWNLGRELVTDPQRTTVPKADGTAVRRNKLLSFIVALVYRALH